MRRPHGSTGWMAVAAACAIVFVVDVVAVVSGFTTPRDRWLDLTIHSTFGASSDGFFEAVSALAEGVPRIVTIVVIVLALFVARYWWSAVVTVVGTGGTAALDVLIKLAVARPRPRLFPHLVHAGGASFPSGHAADSCALALILVVLLFHVLRNSAVTLAAAAVLIPLVGLVGLSRIVLGVHYPTDVVGGYALAGAWIGVVLACFGPALDTEAERVTAYRSVVASS
jgi:membrane-associated phospholipid phosphatase